MLFQPRLPGESEFISVRRTGMIPHWNRDPAPHGYDLSALGCVAPKATPFYVPTSTAEGVRLLPAVLRPETNVPFPIRGTVEPEAYVPDMISGFREVYRFGASHRRELLTQLENVVNTRVRYTLRDTLEYYQALTEMLRSGVTAEAVLGPLPPARAGLSTLRPDETSSLEQLDIPRFTLASASRDLGGVKNCLAASGYELAVQGIEGLSDKDLQQQEAFIQLAWSLFRVSRSLS
jgi:lantibiotic modifying enzyme